MSRGEGVSYGGSCGGTVGLVAAARGGEELAELLGFSAVERGCGSSIMGAWDVCDCGCVGAGAVYNRHLAPDGKMGARGFKLLSMISRKCSASKLFRCPNRIAAQCPIKTWRLQRHRYRSKFRRSESPRNDGPHLPRLYCVCASCAYMCMYTPHPRGPSRVLWVHQTRPFCSLRDKAVDVTAPSARSRHRRPLPSDNPLADTPAGCGDRARSHRKCRFSAVVDATRRRSWSLCPSIMERGDAEYLWYNGPRFALLRIHVPLGTLSGAELSSWLSGTCHA